MPNVGLNRVGQNDVSGGMFQGIARHLIPPNGAYDLINLLLDDVGSAYRRGGSVAKSNAAFAALGHGLMMIADAPLLPSPRTVFANLSDFGVLANDDVTPVNLGGVGSGPAKAHVLDDFMFIGANTGGVIYGGSVKAADYSTGTVAISNGDQQLIGTGTSWLANVDIGMLWTRASKYYIVKSVDSNTQITLERPYEGPTISGQGYTISRLGDASILPAARTRTKFAIAGNRMISFEGDEIHFSLANHPNDWVDDDFHKLGGGANLVGGEGLGSRLVACADDGIWTVSNMAYDLTDSSGNLQQTLEKVHPDITALSHEGIVPWAGGLIVPAVDGVWLVDGISPPQLLSRSIRGLYAGYVRAGYTPGLAAVFNSHLLLPIVASQFGGQWALQDVLVCRLDRPSRTPIGTTYPWTHLAGGGANVPSFVVRRSQRPPLLLGADRSTIAKVVDLGAFFNPTSATKNDHDATTHSWTYISRDFSAPGPTTWRRLRLRQEGVDAAADNPTISASYSTGAAAFTAITGTVPESDGIQPYTLPFVASGRRLRVKLTSASPWASMALRELELFFRPSGKV